MTRSRRRIAHGKEALLLRALFAVSRALPFAWASALGALLSRVARVLPVAAMNRFNTVARHNIALAMPDLSKRERDTIIAGMWENIGRTITEYPHLPALAENPRSPLYQKHVRVTGIEHVRALRGQRPAIFVTAHFGNWELCPPIVRQCGMRVLTVYRAANNPIVDRIIYELRLKISNRLAAKGRDGARIILRSIKEGYHIAMVTDQRLSEGINVPFFSHLAMTSTAAAVLSLKHNAPIIPAHCVRRGAFFDIRIEPPLAASTAQDMAGKVRDITIRINRRMEEWIRRHPEQWMWIHHRWKARR